MASDLRSMLTERLKRFVPGAGGSTLERGHRRARVLAIAASKGGVGKTTTAVSLAAGLAKLAGKRVLLVDLDSQAHIATAFRSVVPTDLPTISQLLLGDRTRARELMEAAYATSVDDLHLTPSDKTLNDTESLLATKIGKEFILRSAIEITRTHYDYIVFDCPPNLGNLTLNALLAADHLIVPSDLTVLSLEGVGDILQTVETIAARLGHRLNVLGVLPTRVDRRNKSLNTTMEQSLHDMFGSLVFDTEIPVGTAAPRAQLEGKTIYDFDKASKVAVAYETFVGEVLAKLNDVAVAKKKVG
ncbi:MAG: ParA family protein [Deltaproteobacteria bacterium]|nr:ParA family protein [Deltaproteobacteria bacterium]